VGSQLEEVKDLANKNQESMLEAAERLDQAVEAIRALAFSDVD
jgi:hypothetical protein